MKYYAKSIITSGAMVIITCALISVSMAQGLTGWITECKNGTLYRLKITNDVAGTEEAIYTDANIYPLHSTWSMDGKYIYFQGRNNGGIWVCDNTGKNPKKLCDASLTNATPNGEYIKKIDTYRPDADYCFYVDGTTYYKVSRLTGAMTSFATACVTIWGEAQISSDGTKATGRSDATLYKLTLGPTGATSCVLLGPKCSPGLSPDGTKIIDVHNYTVIHIHNWDGSINKTITPISPADNTNWSTNSNDYCTYWRETGSGGAGVLQVSTGNQYNMGTINCEIPKLWVGDLPSTSAIQKSGMGSENASMDISIRYSKSFTPIILITFPNVARNANVCLIDSKGTLVNESGQVSGKQMVYSLQGIPNGFYFVKVSCNGGVMQKKVLLMH